MTQFAESVVEDAALAWLVSLGYAVLHGPDIAAGKPAAERSDPDCRDVMLDGRLRQAQRSELPRRDAGRAPSPDAAIRTAAT